MIVETEEGPSLTQKDSKDILIDSYLYALKLNDNAVHKISCDYQRVEHKKLLLKNLLLGFKVSLFSPVGLLMFSYIAVYLMYMSSVNKGYFQN